MILNAEGEEQSKTRKNQDKLHVYLIGKKKGIK